MWWQEGHGIGSIVQDSKHSALLRRALRRTRRGSGARRGGIWRSASGRGRMRRERRCRTGPAPRCWTTWHISISLPRSPGRATASSQKSSQCLEQPVCQISMERECRLGRRGCMDLSSRMPHGVVPLVQRKQGRGAFIKQGGKVPLLQGAQKGNPEWMLQILSAGAGPFGLYRHRCSRSSACSACVTRSRLFRMSS